MDEREWLAKPFEENRARLKSVAYRMLGSPSEADDAVQETWLRLSRSDTSDITNLSGWLTTVLARVCLDMLRSRESRREESLDDQESDEVSARGSVARNPEHETIMADSVGLALLVVLETLAPAERVAFVLHDMFDLPFEEIAPIVSRSPAATRQLASRARRRIRGAPARTHADRSRQREVVDAFLAASRGGDFAALIALLDPNVVLKADEAAVRLGAAKEVHGAEAVAGTFAGRAQVARLALLNGLVGAVWAPGGKPRVAFGFTVADGRITRIELIADAERLGGLDLVLLDA